MIITLKIQIIFQKKSKVADQIYFKFPIELLQGVIFGKKDKRTFLNEALYYSIYAYSEELRDKNEYDETNIQRFNKAAKFLNVTLGNQEKSFAMGESVYHDHSENRCIVNLNIDIFWQFYKEEKSDFDWHCLLAFLALKSIIGRKPYAKTNNTFLLSRMAGFSATNEDHGIKITRYQLDKIKTELQLNWHIVYHGRNTRGFFVGIDINISLEDLMFNSESKKISNREKDLREQKKIAYENTMKKLKKL